MFHDNLYLSQRSFQLEKLQGFRVFGMLNNIQGRQEGKRQIAQGPRGLGGLTN